MSQIEAVAAGTRRKLIFGTTAGLIGPEWCGGVGSLMTLLFLVRDDLAVVTSSAGQAEYGAIAVLVLGVLSSFPGEKTRDGERLRIDAHVPIIRKNGAEVPYLNSPTTILNPTRNHDTAQLWRGRTAQPNRDKNPNPSVISTSRTHKREPIR